MNDIEISKIEMLFVRACKSNDPHRRVCSVYRRFYGRYPKEESEIAVASIISAIAARFNVVNLPDLISELSPHRYWYYGTRDHHSYYTHVTNVMISKIRFSEVPKFGDGFIKNARFRNNS